MASRELPPPGLPPEDLETRRLRAECARELFGEEAPDLMRIGRFSLVSQLGAGGQGAVYVADDPELGRRVALKRLAVADPHHQRRLRQEGQALAKITHPNVVAVYEVGEDETGQPFLVMELVDGQPLHRWLRHEPRPWRQIVDVLMAVGEGLAALHAARVVHRDVKPHNIVITAEGVAKLVDLGIAMVGSEAAPSEADETEPRGMPGTVGYMAPEHLIGRAEARSDQFSFCVTLFEALYGMRPPWSLTRTEGLLRHELPTPVAEGSGELGSSSPASERSQATEPRGAQGRGERARGRVEAVPRGLVQVLARGLQHEVRARYEDMEALLSALRRVRHPGRRWPAISLASLAVVGLGAALLGPRAAPELCDDPTPAHRVWHEQARDTVHAAWVETGSPAAEPTFATVDRMLGEVTTALDDRLARACAEPREGVASQLARAEVASQHRALRGLVDSLAEVEAQGLAELPIRLAGPLHRLGERGPRDACEQTEAILAPKSALREIEALSRRAVAEGVGGRYDDALARLAEAQALARRDDALSPVQARLHLARGRLALEAQRLELARAELDAAQSQAETLGCDGLGSEALALWAKAQVLDPQGSVGEAAQASRTALEKLDRMGIEGLRRAEAHNSRGLVLQRQRQYQAAAAEFREAIAIRERVQPPVPLEVARGMLNLGVALARQGQVDAAIDTLEESRVRWEAALWPEHPSLYKVHANLSYRYLDRGDLVASQRALERALGLAEAGFGPESSRVARLHVAMARVLDFQHEFEAALAHATTADAIMVARHGADDLRRLAALEAIGVVCMDADWPERAATALERALELQASSGEADALSLAIGRGKLAQAYARSGEQQRAQRLYQEAQRTFSADPSLRRDPFYPELLMGWGETLVALKQAERAVAPLRDAVAWWAQSADRPERLAHTRWSLARALCGADLDSARSHATLALEYFRSADHESAAAMVEEIGGWFEVGCVVIE